jgi:hypothetical protein
MIEIRAPEKSAGQTHQNCQGFRFDLCGGDCCSAATTNRRVVAAERASLHQRIKNLAPLLRGADRRSATISTTVRCEQKNPITKE